MAFFACMLWSTAFVGVKYSLNFAPPLFIAGIRFTLAGLILIPFAGRGYFRELKSHLKPLVKMPKSPMEERRKTESPFMIFAGR